jgi:hypothetical protein
MSSIFQKQYLRKIPKSQLKREREKVINEWNNIEYHFTETLFGYDWDSSEELKSIPIFNHFNWIWIEFSKHWNENERHATKVNAHAFFDAYCKQ